MQICDGYEKSEITSDVTATRCVTKTTKMRFKVTIKTYTTFTKWCQMTTVRHGATRARHKTDTNRLFDVASFLFTHWISIQGTMVLRFFYISLYLGAHRLVINMCAFHSFIAFFLVSRFCFGLSLRLLCAIFPLCHLSPFSIPCNATDGLCERWGRSQRISIYLTLVCPSSSSRSLIYHTQVHFIVVWQPDLGPWLCLSLSALLIITGSLSLLGISLHICISSVHYYYFIIYKTVDTLDLWAWKITVRPLKILSLD